MIALLGSAIVLEETHAPAILAQRLSVSRETGAEPDESTPLNPGLTNSRTSPVPILQETQYEESCIGGSLAHAFQRPLELLFLSRACASCSLVIILVAGTTNLIFAALGRTFQDRYGFSTGASSLIYLAVTIGFVIATFLFGATSDHVSRCLARRIRDEMEPEFRLPAMVFGLPLIAVGLIWYGWSIQYHVSWIVPTLGLSVVGIGITTALVGCPCNNDLGSIADG